VNIEAIFIRSAASARDLPCDGLAELALVGRSNVGKSSLINALVRQQVARTSRAPGKTRLANIYRVARGAGKPFYLVDLPGYGYARGGSGDFVELLNEYFGAPAAMPTRNAPSSVAGKPSASRAALLLVDARHPGLQSDRQAWQWLQTVVANGADIAIVATKIDKLARGERIRAMRELESVFETPAQPVSAATGEGLDELWKLIERLANNNSRNSSPPLRGNPRADEARTPRHPRRR
jgi:GTP-binding protein